VKNLKDNEPLLAFSISSVGTEPLSLFSLKSLQKGGSMRTKMISEE